jgi:hypothetical protein
VNFTSRAKEVALECDWEVQVDSQAFEGNGQLARYGGEVQPDQALLLAPRRTPGR